MLPKNVVTAAQKNFGLDWQFAVNLPQAGTAGKITGHIEHIRDTDFKFSGQLITTQSPLKSGPVYIESDIKSGTGNIELNKLKINIKKLGINLPELGIKNPDIVINGNGKIETDSGKIIFETLSIQLENLPPLNLKLCYLPQDNGLLAIQTKNSLPLLEKIVEIFFTDFSKWDKNADLNLELQVKNVKSKPSTELQLRFENLSGSSPDGIFLIDGASGLLRAKMPLSTSEISSTFEIKSGEALLDTFYIDFTKHPLNAKIKSTIPVKNHKVETRANLDWSGLGKLSTDTKLTIGSKTIQHSTQLDLTIDRLSSPFNLFAVEPLSLGKISADGKLILNANIIGDANATSILGRAELDNGSFTSEAIKISGIESFLPFTIMLDENFIPKPNKNITTPTAGYFRIAKIETDPIRITDFKFPLTVSSNQVDFGELPVMNIQNGTFKLSGFNIKNPFSENFILHGVIDADHIDMLNFSPKSLPIDGKIGGDLEFWLLKDHLSTNGKFYGEVYGGNMTISEIYAENLFEPSRQYGADFRVKHLNLEPLSKALDIGRISGRMNLDLSDLVIAYDQPAAFKLRAITTPGSDSSQNISLKAVNTLSVIGTGSGLTGASVGVFSQFFKEFSYAGLGLKCTLDDDIFKIRGLIKEDDVEYIIKKPPLFGINVVNSNPDNLISFSDMLKRLKRVIKN